MAIKKQAPLTIADSAAGFTVPSGIIPNKAVFSLEGGDIRIQTDGTTVTASAGMLLKKDKVHKVNSLEAITNASMIRDGSDSGVLNIQYFDGAQDIETEG